MEEMNKYELFDAYLQGKLSGEELDNFVVRLKEDPSFKEEFDLHALIAKGIEEHRKKELKAFLAERTNRGFIGNPFGKKYTILAAAVLAIFAVMYIGIRQYENIDNSIALKKSEPNKQTESIEVDKSDTAATRMHNWGDNSNEKTPIIQEEENSALNEVAEVEILESTEDMDLVFDNETDYVLSDTVLLNEFESFEPREFKSRNNFSTQASSPKSDNIIAKKELSENSLPVLEDKIQFDTMLAFRIVKFENSLGTKDKSDSLSRLKARANSDEISANKALRADVEIKLRIEYWTSPINYSGYKFDGKKLIIYGKSNDKKIELIKKENANKALPAKLYVKLGNDYYELIDDNTFRAYKPITDEALLKTLK